MQKTLDCVASIVVYNNPPEMLKDAAESFLNSSNLNVKLYVIDNSPTSALESVFSELPVSYHFNGKNVGYGKAHNWALNQAEPSKYHLILNPDIVFSKGVLEELIQYMDMHQDVGIICPRVLNEDSTIQYLNKRQPTVFDLFIRRFIPSWLRFIFKRRLDYYEMKDVGYDGIYDVPFIPGSFMLCRTHILKEVGGFDPRYFMYFEDADLSRKVQQHNYRTVYYPYVTVTHIWERASHKSKKMALILIVNGIRYFNKWGWKFY